MGQPFVSFSSFVFVSSAAVECGSAVPVHGASSPVFTYVNSYSRVSTMSRLRMWSWPMRSSGVKNASPFSIVNRSGW
jgi:hypothetical protein